MLKLVYSMGSKNQKDFQKLRQLGLYTTIPALLLVGPALGYFIGEYLDRFFNTSPWLMIFFIVIGGIASVKQIIAFLSKGDIDNNDN
ncbi:MAG TPA: AtpZ/AtpI family protein [Candidatus Brocadiales bacterium]|nr:AtpZ/AtpI family protein [Candidatus Brocadiales bacterium]